MGILKLSEENADVAAELHTIDFVEELYHEGCRLLDKGLPILPANNKNPCNAAGEPARGWPRVVCTAQRLRRGLDGALKPRQNPRRKKPLSSEPGICLRMGKEAGLIDIETDDSSEREAVDHLFRDVESPHTVSFVSRRGRHDLYCWDARLDVLGGTFKYTTPNGKSVTLRIGGDGKGAQSAIPLTPGRFWLPRQSPDEISPAPLPEVIIQRLLEQARSKAQGTKRPKNVQTVRTKRKPKAENPPTARKTELPKPGLESPGLESWFKRDESPIFDNSVQSVLTVGNGSGQQPQVHTEDTRQEARGSAVEEGVESVGCSADLVGLAVERTLPTEPGQRHRKLFEFARHIKALPDFSEIVTRDDLKPIARRWYTAALPFISTKDFEETLIDFLEGVGKVKYLGDQGPLHILYRQAMEKPFPAITANYQAESIRQLIALCAELQRENLGQPFFLACRSAGAVLGITHSLAAKYLRLLVRSKVLEEVTKGGRGKASEYRYQPKLI